MGARNKKQCLPKIDGDFDISTNRINILKWVKYFNDKTYVKSISAPCDIVKNYKMNYPKLAKRQYNEAIDFFEDNNLYLVIELEIRHVTFEVYLFCNDTVEIRYRYKSRSPVDYLNRYLLENFPQDKVHSGWNNTWNKIQALKTLTNLKKPYNNMMTLLILIF